MLGEREENTFLEVLPPMSCRGGTGGGGYNTRSTFKPCKGGDYPCATKSGVGLERNIY